MTAALERQGEVLVELLRRGSQISNVYGRLDEARRARI